jgi:ketosteroid isomerase-like protein
VDAWVALFSEDAIYMPPGSPPIATRDGLIEVATAGFRHQAAIDIEPIEIQVLGTWAFAMSRVTGHVTLAGSGETVPVDVKQVAIYRRNPSGVWQIARLITNTNSE